MPCYTPEPCRDEKESYRMAKLLNYLSKQGFNIYTEEITIQSLKDHLKSRDWGNVAYLDRYTRKLCEICSQIEGSDMEFRVLYDGRNPDARALAEWWQEHQKYDAERVVIDDIGGE